MVKHVGREGMFQDDGIIEWGRNRTEVPEIASVIELWGKKDHIRFLRDSI